MMSSLGERFERMVDRTGDHHLWLGFSAGDGTPQMRVGSKLTTARRVAWELAFGSIPPHQRVAACAVARRCVRVEHLHLGARPSPAHRESQPAERARAPRGSGSLRELRPGRWALTVSTPDGRRYSTVEGTRLDAEQGMRELRAASGPSEVMLEDLAARYFDSLEAKGRSAATIRRYHQLWADWLAPTLGALPAERVTPARLERVLRAMTRSGQSSSSVHQAAVVLSGVFFAAHAAGGVKTNPMIGLTLPNGDTLQRPRRRGQESGPGR